MAIVNNKGITPIRLSALQLDRAPSSPGIYAWYANVALSESDWKPRMREGVDTAETFLINAINDYARAHQHGSIRLRGQGGYHLTWKGELKQENVSDSQEQTSTTNLESHLSEISRNPEDRKLLSALLKSAPPVFASPLYIGVATNLKQRLAEHRKAFETASAAIRQRPDRASALQHRGKDLGTRLAGAGIAFEHLECWVLPTADLGVSSSLGTPKQRVVAQAAEWVLQRIFQPVLGRQ